MGQDSLDFLGSLVEEWISWTAHRHGGGGRDSGSQGLGPAWAPLPPTVLSSDPHLY